MGIFRIMCIILLFIYFISIVCIIGIVGYWGDKSEYIMVFFFYEVDGRVM